MTRGFSCRDSELRCRSEEAAGTAEQSIKQSRRGRGASLEGGPRGFRSPPQFVRPETMGGLREHFLGLKFGFCGHVRLVLKTQSIS